MRSTRVRGGWAETSWLKAWRAGCKLFGRTCFGRVGVSDQSAPAGKRGRVSPYVVTLNAGSSSIKFALFEASGEEPPNVATGIVEMLPEGRRIAVQDGAGKATHEA